MDELPEMKKVQRAGITIHDDRIVVHLEDQQATVELEELIRRRNDEGEVEPLLLWTVFWQLLTLNKSVQDAMQRSEAAMQGIGNPQAMAKSMMSDLMKVVRGKGE